VPSLINSVDVRPRVSYRTIQIGPIFFEEAPAEDDIVQIPGDGWSLTSSDNDFYPLVRLEVWDGPAREPAGPWDYVREFRAPLGDSLCVVDLGGVVYGEIVLRPGPYQLRLLCQGRDHVEALIALDPFPPQGPHEDPLEVWVAQMWPDD
jgi:pimeloyl-ACP methyl ester carboxylesterase